MKIAQVCHRYYPEIGGVEQHVQNISERLAIANEVTVLTTDPTGNLPVNENVNNVKILRFKSWAPKGAYYISNELNNYLKMNLKDFDIVHAHNYHSLPALYAAKAKDVHKLIFTPHYHGTGSTFFRKILHLPYRYLGKTIFKKANKVVVKFPKGEIREFKAQQVRKLYNQDQERNSLKDYYAKAYGDDAFAQALTQRRGR